MFTPVLAKHTKSFNLIDTLAVGVDRIQRNFFRASRSHILNLRQIQSLDKEPDGGLVAMLTDGTKVAITQRQSQKLRERLSL